MAPDDADDDVDDGAEAGTAHDAAGEVAGDQADEDPDKDGVRALSGLDVAAEIDVVGVHVLLLNLRVSWSQSGWCGGWLCGELFGREISYHFPPPRLFGPKVSKCRG